jgi:putative FmdB family regulatory protein
MPTYEYECKSCGHSFETKLTIREHDKHPVPRCPKCGSQKVEQRPAPFQAITASKA